MNRLNPSFLGAIVLVNMCISIAWAQTEDGRDGDKIGQFELSVPKKYQANIVDALKIADNPETTDTTIKKKPVNYSITAQPVSVTFTPEPLTAARIARIPVEKLHQGYALGGYGLYGSPLAEFYYNSNRSTKYNFGLAARHFSTQRGISDIVYDNNAMSRNSFDGHFNRFYKHLHWFTKVGLSFNKTSFYGLPQIEGLSEDSTISESPHIWRQAYSIQTGIKEKNEKDMGVLSSAAVDYYHFNDNFKSAENNGGLQTEWSFPVEDLALETGLNLRYYSTDFDSIVRPLDSTGVLQQSYFTVNLNPRINVNYNAIKFRFGLNLYNISGDYSLGDSTISDFRFFPVAQAEYVLVEEVLSLEAGIRGYLQHNTYRSLSRQNSFIDPGQIVTPTKTTDVYAGLKGKLSGNTSFSLRGGYQNKKDMPLFFRSSLFYLPNAIPGIVTLYDDADIFYAQGGIEAQLTTNLYVSGNAKLQSFSMNEVEEAWHLPNFTAELEARYLWLDKVQFSTQLYFVGARPAFPQESADLSAFDGELNSYLNADAGIEYLYNSRLSAFLKARNLLNDNYALYLGYPNQNVNVFFGFTYKF